MTDQNGVSFRESPQAALAVYQEQGFFVEPDVVPPEMCDSLVRAARAAAADSNFKPIMNPHRIVPMFLDLMRYGPLVQIMEHLVGGKVSGLQSEFFFTKVGTRGFAKHQDNFFVEAPEDAFASAWTALTDVTPERGGLVLYRGSHLAGRLAVRRIQTEADAGQDLNAANEESVVPDQYPPVDVPVKKGSVVLLHAHVVHSSRRNEAADFRYAVLNTYIRSGEKFRPGQTARREEVPLAV
jgi:ectoine hydroxylase-related dioxygenase (phytanoyl-CoA dioxygenase family)